MSLNRLDVVGMAVSLAIAVVVIALCVFGCTPPRAPLAAAEGRGAVLQLHIAVRAAAVQCAADVQFIAQRDRAAAQRLADECVDALIPAQDAVTFAVNDVDPWTRESEGVVGCMALAARVALERVNAAFTMGGFAVPETMTDGLIVSRRIAERAPAWCDPRRPTTRVTVYLP